MDADTFDRIMLESISEEIKARDFYKSAAGKMKDESVRAIFEGLSREEELHRVKLEEFRFNPNAAVEFEKIENDYGVAEAENLPEFTFDMTPRDAFQLAMKKEQQAMQIYENLASQCKDPEFKQLYLELAGMEKGHKTRLEDLFINAAFPEDWGD